MAKYLHFQIMRGEGVGAILRILMSLVIFDVSLMWRASSRRICLAGLLLVVEYFHLSIPTLLPPPEENEENLNRVTKA